MDKVLIFDTTLRDGEQAPGASLGMEEKLEVARQLARLGVDIIEAGFPIASPGDFESVRAIAREIKGPRICGLARASKKDIDTAAKAIKPAKRSRIHVFLATSKIHMKYKLKKAEDEILKQAVWAVKYAGRFCDDIEFSPEDASRTEPEFLYKVLEAVIDAGAKTVNIPDTVGYAMPFQFGDLIRGIRENVTNIDKAVISVHCHDDLGLSVSNSLEAVKNGARQVECTINGIGERAGNASLEEVVMGLATRADVFGVETGIRKKELYKTSRLVSALTGFVVPPNKAVVGRNAFRHEAGIHQDGILKERTTYEIMQPQDVGFGETHLVLGKHSGRHAFSARLKELGFSVSPKALDEAFAEFKCLADKKKEVFDEDLAAIVEDKIGEVPEAYRLAGFRIASGTDVSPSGWVRLKFKGKNVDASSEGDGPVDACYKAIDKLTNMHPRLEDYSLRAITGEKEALGEASVKLRLKGRVVSGRGASTDVIEASLKAYLNGANKLIRSAK